MITLLAFIFVLSLVVFVHELGHFLTAKAKGVAVQEFGFGIPPRIWSKKVGETVYSINFFPIGGFCKFLDDEGKHNHPRSFNSKSKKERILIASAGPIMNLFLAILILTLLYTVGFKTNLIPGMGDHAGVVNTQKIRIIGVDKNSPAEKEGLKEGDIINKIGGQKVSVDTEVLAKINELTTKNPDEKIGIEIERDSKTSVKNIQTFEDRIKGSNNKEITVRRVGITLETLGEAKAPFYLAPYIATTETFRLMGLTFVGVLDFFGKLLTKFSLSENATSFVGIAGMAGASAKMGVLPLLQFSAILSISLAVLNIMPIPALDGGHIFIMVLEKIARRDFSMKAKNIIQLTGFGLLLLLMIILTIRDLSLVDLLKRIF
ncbi:MAG: M50 family metallopeptidase [Patescibacteria group bacterium]|nr:M50 family metallopeptidase [Patescibacteria group bacterium]MCL5094188.1 M50 family metallopeptidase [Patescibacteria group bacterium]